MLKQLKDTQSSTKPKQIKKWVQFRFSIYSVCISDKISSLACLWPTLCLVEVSTYLAIGWHHHSFFCLDEEKGGNDDN